MEYPPASQTSKFGAVPKGVANAPDAQTETAIAEASGLMPAA